MQARRSARGKINVSGRMGAQMMPLRATYGRRLKNRRHRRKRVMGIDSPGRINAPQDEPCDAGKKPAYSPFLESLCASFSRIRADLPERSRR